MGKKIGFLWSSARVLERKNEYFSFKKNIPKMILRWIRSGMMIREGNDALG